MQIRNESEPNQASQCPSVLTQHNISCLGFFLKQYTIVKVAIDKSHSRVLAGNLSTFIAVANKARNVKLWMSIGNRIEGIATNVSCRTGAIIIRESVGKDRHERPTYRKTLGAAMVTQVSILSDKRPGG